MERIVLPKGYEYFYDIVRCVRDNKPIPDEFNLVGGRKSGKTTVYILL